MINPFRWIKGRSGRTFAVMILSVVAGGVAGFAIVSHLRPLLPSVPPVPLTASMVERAINDDGTERHRFVRTLARRSDGALAVKERRFYKGPEGQPLELEFRYVQDVSKRELISIYPEINARITSRLSDRSIQALRTKPDAGCVGSGFETDPSAPQESIAGQPVIVRARTLISKDGSRHGPSEREWVAEGLDCFVMRREFRSSGQESSFRGSVTMEVVNISVGEPSKELFLIPAGLKEMLPSEVIKAQNDLQGIECTACDLKTGENADRRYRANRTTAP